MEARRPLRVFLVEDSVPIRERLLESLVAAGRIESVGYADSEATALTALRTLEWDVVVLDLQLKQGNGFKLLKTLRDVRAPGAKVIVFTNYAFPLFLSKSMQLGADYFFDKAREFDRLRQVLGAFADERQQAENPQESAQRATKN